jgi:hypothetical protein
VLPGEGPLDVSRKRVQLALTVVVTLAKHSQKVLGSPRADAMVLTAFHDSLFIQARGLIEFLMRPSKRDTVHRTDFIGDWEPSELTQARLGAHLEQINQRVAHLIEYPQGSGLFNPVPSSMTCSTLWMSSRTR